MENNVPTPIQENPQSQTPPVPPQAPYGQPVYQQPPYGQPVYQQPYNVPQQPPRESLFKKLYGKADTLLGKLLMWVSIVLIALVPTTLLLSFIGGVITAISYESFMSFISAIVSGVQWAAIYAFMGSLLAFAKNRLDQ